MRRWDRPWLLREMLFVSKSWAPLGVIIRHDAFLEGLRFLCGFVCVFLLFVFACVLSKRPQGETAPPEPKMPFALNSWPALAGIVFSIAFQFLLKVEVIRVCVRVHCFEILRVCGAFTFVTCACLCIQLLFLSVLSSFCVPGQTMGVVRQESIIGVVGLVCWLGCFQAMGAAMAPIVQYVSSLFYVCDVLGMPALRGVNMKPSVLSAHILVMYAHGQVMMPFVATPLFEAMNSCLSVLECSDVTYQSGDAPAGSFWDSASYDTFDSQEEATLLEQLFEFDEPQATGLLPSRCRRLDARASMSTLPVPRGWNGVSREDAWLLVDAATLTLGRVEWAIESPDGASRRWVSVLYYSDAARCYMVHASQLGRDPAFYYVRVDTSAMCRFRPPLGIRPEQLREPVELIDEINWNSLTVSMEFLDGPLSELSDSIMREAVHGPVHRLETYVASGRCVEDLRVRPAQERMALFNRVFCLPRPFTREVAAGFHRLLIALDTPVGKTIRKKSRDRVVYQSGKVSESFDDDLAPSDVTHPYVQVFGPQVPNDVSEEVPSVGPNHPQREELRVELFAPVVRTTDELDANGYGSRCIASKKFGFGDFVDEATYEIAWTKFVEHVLPRIWAESDDNMVLHPSGAVDWFRGSHPEQAVGLARCTVWYAKGVGDFSLANFCRGQLRSMTRRARRTRRTIDEFGEESKTVRDPARARALVSKEMKRHADAQTRLVEPGHGVDVPINRVPKVLFDFLEPKDQKRLAEFGVQSRPIILYGKAIETELEVIQVEGLFKHDKGLLRQLREFVKLGNPPDLFPELDARIRRAFQKQSHQISRRDAAANLAHVKYQNGTSDGIEALRELVGEAWEIQMGEFRFARFALFAVQMYRAPSALDAVLCMLAYFGDFESVRKLASSALRTLYEELKSLESTGSLVYQNGVHWSSHPLFSHLWSVLASLSLAHLLNQHSSTIGGYGMSVLREKAMVGTKKTESVLERLMSFLVESLKIVVECAKQQSLDPLFRGCLDLKGWQLRANAVLTYRQILVISQGQASDEQFRDLHRRKVIPEHWTEQFTNVAFRDELTTIVAEGEGFLPHLSDPAMGSIVNSLLKRVRLLMEECIADFANSAYRIQPLGIMLTGPPGFGKTVLMQQTFRSLGNLMGWDTSSVSEYSWQVGVNFQDGLGATQWGIYMDDIDADVSTPSRGSSNHVLDVMNVINNKPFPVEQARVEAKGTVVARPLLVQYASNFPDGRLEGYAADAQAFWRRLRLKVEIRPRPEFLGKDGLLSQRLVNGAVDIHEIDVYEYDRTLYRESARLAPTYKLVASCLTNREYYAWVAAYMKVHLHNQRALLAKMVCGPDHCPVCGVTTTGTACCVSDGHLEVRYQNSYVDLAFYVATAAFAFWFGHFVCRPLAHRFDQYASTASKEYAGTRKVVQVASNVFKWSGLSVMALQLCQTVLLGLVAAKFWASQRQYQSDNGNTVGGVNYTRMGTAYPVGVTPFRGATWTRDELMDSVRRARVEVTNASGQQTNGLIVTHNAVLVNDHVVEGEVVTVSGPTWREDVRVSPLTYRKIGDTDTGVLLCHNIPAGWGMINKIWVSPDTSVVQFDDAVMIDRVGERGLTKPQVVRTELRPYNGAARRLHGGLHIVHETLTVTGDCGLVYAACVGSSWRCVAIHSFRDELKKRGFGACIDQQSIKAAVLSLGTQPSRGEYCVKQMTSKPSLQMLESYKEGRSEVLYANEKLRMGFFPIGRAVPQVHGSTQATKVHPTVYAKFFDDFAVQVCGSVDYWQPPLLRNNGVWDAQEGGGLVWISPFQHAYKPFVRSLDKVDMYLWWLALMDYLLPLRDLDCDGYRVLSQQESMRGLPEMRTGPVNMNTSAGMPFNRPKKAGMYWVSAEREFYVSTPMEEVYGEIIKILESGEIPIPVSLCTLKDEGVKKSKNEKRDLRVFCIMSAAFNTTCKERTAGVHAFLRAYRDVFECAVGVNMGSTDVGLLVARLAQVDPSLKRVVETDMVKQDKSQNGLHCSSSARAMYALSRALGLTKQTALEVWSLSEGLRSTVYVEKNDLYQMGGRNPSGSNETVEQNSIDNSITDRYARLRAKKVVLSEEDKAAIEMYAALFFDDPLGIPQGLVRLLDYRENVAAFTYGDDAMRAFAENIDMELYASAYAETGLVLTDADKTCPVIKYKNLSDITFLKRHILFDKDLGQYIAPLDERSIIRMLRLNKGSTLSDKDHDSIAMEEALRELVFHGREKFDKYRERMLKVKDELGLDHCYLHLGSFDEYWQMVKDGNFQTWIDSGQDLKHLETCLAVSDLIVYQMNSQVKLEPASAGAKGSEDQGCKTAPAMGEGNPQSHSSGVIQGTGMVDCTELPTGRAMSKLDTLSLQDWPSRNVLIQTVSLTTSSSAMTSLLDFDPHNSWFANTYVQARLGNTFYMRGKLVLDIVTLAQPGCYGMVTVSAKPRGGPTPFNYQEVLVATTVPRQQLKCVPHVDIDLALSGRATLELPWCGPVDWASTSTVQGIYTWANPAQYIVSVFNWATVGNADGTTAGANMAIYARLDDAELAVMNYQGKWADAAGVVSSAAGALAMVPAFAPVASTVATIAGGASKLLDYFGFTRQGVEPTADSMKMVSHTSLGPVDAQDNSEKVALYTNNAIVKNPSVAGGLNDSDPTALAYLFAHWTFLDAVSWTGNSTTSTEIYTMPVTPYGAVITGTSSTWLELSVAGYVGLPFAQWRGSMEYLIVPLVSKFHRGALQVYWSPTCTGPAAVADITNLTSNVIFNAAPGLREHFVVGFAGQTPALASQIISNNTPSSLWQMAYCNGQIGIRVAVPLVASNGVGSNASATILVFARGGADMRFGVPRATISEQNVTYGIMELGSIQYQSGAIGDEATITVETHVLVPPMEYPAKDILWGEVFHSVRPLFQKLSRVNEGATSSSGSAPYWTLQWAIPHVPRPILYWYNNNNTVTAWSPGIGIFDWAVHYINLYAGFAGGVRYKVKAFDVDANNPSNVNMVCSATPWREAQMQILSPERRDMGLEGFQQIGLNAMAEFDVPSYQHINYQKVNLQDAHVVSGSGPVAPTDQSWFTYDLIRIAVGAVNTGTSTARPPYINFWRGCSTDTRVNLFTGHPQVRFASGTLGTYYNQFGGQF